MHKRKIWAHLLGERSVLVCGHFPHLGAQEGARVAYAVRRVVEHLPPAPNQALELVRRRVDYGDLACDDLAMVAWGDEQGGTLFERVNQSVGDREDALLRSEVQASEPIRL